MLAAAECSTSRISVYHSETHLFLWVSTQEIRKLVRLSVYNYLYQYRGRMSLLGPATFRREVDRTRGLIAIGSR